MRPLVTSIVVSLLFHLSLFYSMYRVHVAPINSNLVKDAPKQSYTKITLQKSKPTATNQKPNTSPPPKKSSFPKRAQSLKTKGSLQQSYSQLLMQSQDFINKSDQPKTKSRYKGAGISTVKEQANIISSRIDIPVYNFRDLSSGKAIAYLKLDKGKIVIKSLVGTSILRALLFETLRQSKANLTYLFSLYRKEDLTFVLNYKKNLASYNEYEFETSQQMFEDSIEMNIIRFEDYRKFGAGIAIEDYYSRLTKRREKLYLKKLKDTVAYKRPLRDYIL